MSFDRFSWFRVLVALADIFLGGAARRELRVQAQYESKGYVTYATLYTVFAPLYCLYLPVSIFWPRLMSYLFFSDEIKSVFDLLDSNRDGVITIMDFVTLRSIRELFTIITFSVVPPYYLSLSLRQITLYDLFVFQRVFVVGPAIMLTLLAGQSALRNHNILGVAFIFDVVGGFVHGLMAPGGYYGIFQRLGKLARATALTPWHRQLREEALMGIQFGLLSTAWAAITGQTPLLTFIIAVATIVQYLWIWHGAQDQTDKTTSRILGLRIYWIIGHVILAEVLHVGELPLACAEYLCPMKPLRCMYANLTLGLLRPRLGAFSSAIGSSVVYLQIYTHLLNRDFDVRQEGHESNILVWWMAVWSIVHLILSFGWKKLFFSTYTIEQQRRLSRIMFQDQLVAVFILAVAGVLNRGGTLGKDNALGAMIGLALPAVSLWFQTESKLLVHMRSSGTPFHPTWWANGDVPKYSSREIINLSFSMATALMTVVSTSLAVFAIGYTVGFSQSIRLDAKVWKFAAVHGILFVFHSGIWMIIASSGIPAIGTHRMFSYLAIPPLIRADPYHCVFIHRFDLGFGVCLLVAAAFLPMEFAEFTTDYIKYTIVAVWIFTLCWKVWRHIHDFGYKAKVELEQSVPGNPHVHSLQQDFTPTSALSSVGTPLQIPSPRDDWLRTRTPQRRRRRATPAARLGLPPHLARLMGIDPQSSDDESESPHHSPLHRMGT